MVEKEKYADENLQLQVDRLRAEGVQLIHGDVLEMIPNLDRKYDLIFIDPPYALASMRQQVMSALEMHHRLHRGAKIYFEWPQGESFDPAFGHLTWLKQKKAGQVNYAIAEWWVSR